MNDDELKEKAFTRGVENTASTDQKEDYSDFNPNKCEE